MSKSRRSSNASAPFLLEWRPSRGLAAALCALALLAGCSLLASDLPRGLAWPLAVLAAAGGLLDARRYARQPPRMFLIPAGAADASCRGVRMAAMRLRWRGPLAFLRWADPQGRVHRLVFLPDTLPARARRELKLAMQRREAAAGAASMAG